MQALNQQTLFRRAQQCFAQGRIQEAKSIGEQLLAHDKNNPDLLFLLAEIANLTTHYDQSIAYLKRCVSIKPRSIPFLLTLATRYMGRGENANAIAMYKKAHKVDPNCLDAVAGQAVVLEMEGDFDAARALVQPYIDSGRENAWMAQAYATLEMRAKRPENAVAALLRHANANASSDLFFDLGKAYEKLKDYDNAFKAYATGNERSKRPYDLPAYLDFVKRLITTFSPLNMKRLPRARHGSRLPILVTSRPRSGTTLVERIICAHPDVFGAGELPFITHMTERLNLEIGSGKVFPECAADMDQNDVDRLGQAYIDHLQSLGGNVSRVVDKNMATMYNLAFVNLIAPQTAAILCTRDPVDNCLSCYCEDIRHRHHYATDLRLLGITYEVYMMLRQYWIDTLDIPMLPVSYEDVVVDQEGMSRKIIDFCGLDWRDECLRFYESERPSTPAAPTLSYDQVRQPIYKTSVGRAKNFEKHLGPLLEGFEEGRRVADQIRAELKLE